jgi:hypothetical protein
MYIYVVCCTECPLMCICTTLNYVGEIREASHQFLTEWHPSDRRLHICGGWRNKLSYKCSKNDQNHLWRLRAILIETVDWPLWSLQSHSIWHMGTSICCKCTLIVLLTVTVKSLKICSFFLRLPIHFCMFNGWNICWIWGSCGGYGTVSWFVRQCRLEKAWCLWETHHLHHEVWRVSQARNQQK